MGMSIFIGEQGLLERRKMLMKTEKWRSILRVMNGLFTDPLPPQRHRHKRSTHHRRKFSTSARMVYPDPELDEVGEREVPPKMKRRSMHRRKELHIADRTVSGPTSMEIDQDHDDVVRAQNVTPNSTALALSSSSILIPTISMTAPSPPQIPLPPP
ncbi:hypothetical protein BT96DRAFT_1006722 [Gymnopus androsaceus JB14]|uniref:Uncharacterized protein n=1 Tax=Gymnopus androsaceus JB14 TaxID=1447944 RepID=A0A6A4GK64_9AGAR|nr:hypothetical protein BT96DRAFT_1006722 [Gymnopus androsaceus JB14]